MAGATSATAAAMARGLNTAERMAVTAARRAALVGILLDCARQDRPMPSNDALADAMIAAGQTLPLGEAQRATAISGLLHDLQCIGRLKVTRRAGQRATGRSAARQVTIVLPEGGTACTPWPAADAGHEHAHTATRRVMLMAVLEDVARDGRPLPVNTALARMLAVRGAVVSDDAELAASMVSNDLIRLAARGRLTVERRADPTGGVTARRRVVIHDAAGDRATAWSDSAMAAPPRRPHSDGIADLVPPRREALVETHMQRLRRQGMSAVAIQRALGITQRQAAEIGLGLPPA